MRFIAQSNTLLKYHKQVLNNIPADVVDIAYGNNRHVAVSIESTHYSIDGGTTWVSREQPRASANALMSFANLSQYPDMYMYHTVYNGNIESFNLLLTSQRVEYSSAHGKFLWVGKCGLAHSEDGYTWTFTSPFDANTYCQSIAVSNSTVVVSGTIWGAGPTTAGSPTLGSPLLVVYTSNDPTNASSWSTTLTANHHCSGEVVYIPQIGKFVMTAAGNGVGLANIEGGAWSSADGVTWTKLNIPQSLFYGTYLVPESNTTNSVRYKQPWASFSAPVYANGKLVIGIPTLTLSAFSSDTIPPRFLYSEDEGNTWNRANTIVDGTDLSNGYVNTNSGSYVRYDPLKLPSSSSIGDAPRPKMKFTYDPVANVFILGGTGANYSSVQGSSVFLKSSDLVNWTTITGGVTPNTPSIPNMITYRDYRYKFVPNLGTVMMGPTKVRTSDGGATWFVYNTSTHPTQAVYVPNHNKYYALYDKNIVLSGNTIDNLNSANTRPLYSSANIGYYQTILAWVNGQQIQTQQWVRTVLSSSQDIDYSPTLNCFAVATLSGILTSNDCITWNHVYTNSNVSFSTIDWDGSRFIAAGNDYRKTFLQGRENSLFISTDAVNWTPVPLIKSDISNTSTSNVNISFVVDNMLLEPGKLLLEAFMLNANQTGYLATPYHIVVNSNNTQQKRLASDGVLLRYMGRKNGSELVAVTNPQSFSATYYSNGYISSSDSVVQKSIDGGMSWSTTTTMQNLIQSIVVSNDTLLPIPTNNYIFSVLGGLQVIYDDVQQHYWMFNLYMKTLYNSTVQDHIVLKSADGVTWKRVPNELAYQRLKSYNGDGIRQPVYNTPSSVPILPFFARKIKNSNTIIIQTMTHPVAANTSTAPSTRPYRASASGPQSYSFMITN